MQADRGPKVQVQCVVEMTDMMIGASRLYHSQLTLSSARPRPLRALGTMRDGLQRSQEFLFLFFFNAILQSMQIPPGVSYQESSD